MPMDEEVIIGDLLHAWIDGDRRKLLISCAE